MNETVRALLERKSVRAFTEEPISAQAEELILRAACEAPTAGNQQLYSILRITDPALKAALAENCDHQPFIAAAPLVLVFVTDVLRWYDAFREAGCEPRRPGAGDLLLAAEDTMIAAQNAVTAAWSLGIGSCYIGDILEQRETQRELLGLPEYTVPLGMLVFGYPTEQQKNRPKPARHALSNIVMENRYTRRDGAALRRMYAEKAGTQGYDAWMQAFCKRKWNSDFSREMQRSAGEYTAEYVQPEK